MTHKEVNKEYIVVDFGGQPKDRDRYYILRTYFIPKSTNINYNKYYYIENDEVVSDTTFSNYSELNILFQYNSEEKAIKKLKFLYDTLKYNI